MVCCLPGAQVGDTLTRAGRDPVVMVHVGTNKGRFEVLQDTFVE